tara:strand:- start:10356 stop:10835 length:480 start_codon:yes stop_codon:yes gene_type:complete
MITVTSRKRLGDPWESSQGNTYFPFVVNLSDGTTVMANGASEDPWWKEGTPVVFKDSGNRTKKGLPKGGFDKAEGVIPSATPAANRTIVANADREIGMRVGMSINNACNLLRGGDYSEQEFDAKLERLARSIYTVAERIASSPSGESPAATTGDEETPF